MTKIYKNNDKILLTDLASEWGIGKRAKRDETVSSFEITLNADDARRIKKAPGRYLTFESKAIKEMLQEDYVRLKTALISGLRTFLKGNDLFVVGLGNSALTADSLGVRVCSKVNATRNIIPSNIKVSCLPAGVLGRTGIESWEVVKGVVGVIKPSTVIVVDSLCAGSYSRLFTSFQISNAGIVPGSGVGNSRIKIDKQSVGCEVVSIGVPTVMYASTLIKENSGDFPIEDMVVTPKDIDFFVEDCACVISEVINEIVVKG